MADFQEIFSEITEGAGSRKQLNTQFIGHFIGIFQILLGVIHRSINSFVDTGWIRPLLRPHFPYRFFQKIRKDNGFQIGGYSVCCGVSGTHMVSGI
jgi:hypothetical protein